MGQSEVFEYTDGSYLEPNGPFDVREPGTALGADPRHLDQSSPPTLPSSQPYHLSRRTSGASRDCASIDREGTVSVALCGTGHKSSVCKKPAEDESRPFCRDFKASQTRPCPNHWIPSSRGRPACYYKMPSGSTWTEGLAECQELGASLAVFPDDDTHKAVTAICERTSPARCAIGLSDREEEGTWAWEDGSPVQESLASLHDRRSWDNCARLDGSGEVTAVGCNGEAGAGNLRAVCQMGMGASGGGVITDLRPVDPEDDDTGPEGALAWAHGEYEAGAEVLVTVTYTDSDGPRLQWFVIDAVLPGGGKNTTAAFSVPNGQAGTVNLGASFSGGEIIQLKHSSMAGEQPGGIGVNPAAQWINGSAATTQLRVPGAGLDEMQVLPAPVVEPATGSYLTSEVQVNTTVDRTDIPGSSPEIWYRMDRRAPSPDDGVSMLYRGNITLTTSMGQKQHLSFRAFKTGFIASNVTRVRYLLGEEACPTRTGIVCSTGPCSDMYHWCVKGEASVDQPVPAGTLCYKGKMVPHHGRQCSGRNTPTDSLTPPEPRPYINATGGPNPDIPGSCSAYLPSNACAGKRNRWYCMNDCEANNTCMYQCVGGGVAQQQETPAGTVCAKGKIVHERGPQCGWAGPYPSEGEWFNCEGQRKRGIHCAGSTGCSAFYYNCGWGGFAPKQPVAPGTVCAVNPRNGRSRIKHASTYSCPVPCDVDNSFTCGRPTSTGSTCSFKVNYCTSRGGASERGTFDLRKRSLSGNATTSASALMLCERRGGYGLDRIVPASEADCGSPALQPYSPGVCASEPPNRRGARVVCESTCSTTYSVCAGTVSLGNDLPVPDGTRCRNGRMVHARRCANGGGGANMTVIRRQVEQANSTAARALLSRSEPVARVTALRSPRLDDEEPCMSLELVIPGGAGGHLGTVGGQALVADTVASVVAVPGATVDYTSGAFVVTVALCDGQPCQPSPTPAPTPIAQPPSLVEMGALPDSLNAPLELPEGVPVEADVQLSFDICGVPESERNAVTGRLAASGALSFGGYPVAVPAGGIVDPANSTEPQGPSNCGSCGKTDGPNVPLVAGLSALGLVIVVVAGVFLWRRSAGRTEPHVEVARRSSRRLEEGDVELSDRQPDDRPKK